MDLDFAERAKELAERVLKASGSSLANYSLPGNRSRILLAALDGYEEAFRAGAKYATDKLKPTGSQDND